MKRAVLLIAAAAAVAMFVPGARKSSAAEGMPCAPHVYEVIPAPAAPVATPFPSSPPGPAMRGTGSQRTITVTGVEAVPHAADTAYVDVRLTTSDADAATAGCANERAYDDLRAKTAATTVIGTTSSPFAFGSPTTAQHASAGWYVHRDLRFQATPARWRDTVAAVEAAHAKVLDVQFAVTDLRTLHELPTAAAMREAARLAGEYARSQNVTLGPLLKIVIDPVPRSALTSPITPDTAVANGAPPPVSLRGAVTATYAVATPNDARGPSGTAIVVRAFGIAARAPDAVRLLVTFREGGDDRTALLYRHETAYDALWAALRALGVTADQVPVTTPRVEQTVRSGPGAPSPASSSAPAFAYFLTDLVTVNALPIAELQPVVAAFASAGAKSVEATFSVNDRAALLADANADLRRNGDAEARAVARVAGLRLVEEPFIESTGMAASQVFVRAAPIVAPDRPPVIVPPAAIEMPQRATIFYAAVR